MHDEGLLKKSLEEGHTFYVGESRIYANLTSNCFIVKCFNQTCGSQSTQSCDGQVEDQPFFSNLNSVNREEFKKIWRNAPHIQPAPERYYCPDCDKKATAIPN